MSEKEQIRNTKENTINMQEHFNPKIEESCHRYNFEDTSQSIPN